VTIALTRTDGHLSFSVADDGVGFDTGSTTQGTGLRGIEDRLNALGGTVRIESSEGTGTTVGGSVPIAPPR
jgi:signal transduction histidine kinase